MTSSTSTVSTSGAAAAAALRPTFTGPLILPGDAAYDEARRVWNGMIDRYPALIARCATTDDARAAVRCARDQGLSLAVRGGGHNAAGFATCDDGLVVDLSAMRRVDVNASRRQAVVEGGATWADVDWATQAHGRATPGGAVAAARRDPHAVGVGCTSTLVDDPHRPLGDGWCSVARAVARDCLQGMCWEIGGVNGGGGGNGCTQRNREAEGTNHVVDPEGGLCVSGPLCAPVPP